MTEQDEKKIQALKNKSLYDYANIQNYVLSTSIALQRAKMRLNDGLHQLRYNQQYYKSIVANGIKWITRKELEGEIQRARDSIKGFEKDLDKIENSL